MTSPRFASARSLTGAVVAVLLLASGLVVQPAGAHDPTEFTDIHAPFACGTEWSGGTRAGHGQNNWNLDFNRTSLVWPDNDHDHGQPLFAQGPGTVTYIGWQVNAGTYMDIDYGDYAARYIHLVDDSVVPALGDVVATGDTIALVGDTGNTNGFAHLHLEYWDSRGFDDARIWELKQAGQPQTEVTFDGNVVDPDEVIVSTNCEGDALVAGEDPPTEPAPTPPDNEGLSPLVHDLFHVAAEGRSEVIELFAGAVDPLETLAANPDDLTDPDTLADYVRGNAIIGMSTGTTTPDEAVLVLASVDTLTPCPADQADDDTEAVACLNPVVDAAPATTVIELARSLGDTDRTVIFAIVERNTGDTSALDDLLNQVDDTALADAIDTVVTVVDVGPLGAVAAPRLRDDSFAIIDPVEFDWATVTSTTDHPTELTWHRSVSDPLGRDEAISLAAFGRPVIGVADLPGACATDTAATAVDVNAAKLLRQHATITTIVRTLAGLDTLASEDLPADNLADPTATLLDDLQTIITVAAEAEVTDDDALTRIDAFVAEPPEPITLDDVATMQADVARVLGALTADECAALDAPGPFADVALTSYALDDVALLFDLRITTGTSPTTYSPADFVTREQMAAFLARIWRLLNPDAIAQEAIPFSDVDASSYAYDDVRLLWELEITTGTSPTRYSPDDFVTREQMAAFLARMWRLLIPPTDDDPAIDPHPFTDVDPESFAVDDVSLIFDLGITTGTSATTYSPDDQVTREQMAAFLARLLRRHAEPEPEVELAPD